MKIFKESQTKYEGSSFLLPTLGRGGARATINNDSPSASKKFLTKPRSRREKRKESLSVIPTNEFFSPYGRQLKACLVENLFSFGVSVRIFFKSGEGGIRTHDPLSRIYALQAYALNHSATSPLFSYATIYL